MNELTPADFNGIDAIVHLAAHSANVPYDTLSNCLYWNVTVPLKMFEIACHAGVRRFIVAGSCFEYGKAGERYEFIPPDAPLEATASYPASKAAASIAFRSFASETSSLLSIHRIFHVYGEGEPENRLWPTLRNAALTGKNLDLTPGDQVRDFVPVELVARQFLLALSNDKLTNGTAFIENVGSGYPQTLRQFTQSFWKKWNASGQLNFGAVAYRRDEVMRYVPEL